MSTISQKEEEHLQKLFCPALDAELVLSVLHDLQDYDKAVELLGTLCAESPPDISDPISASAFAHEQNIVTFREPHEDVHRLALLFEDGNSDLLVSASESWVDRDLAGKLNGFHMDGRAVSPLRSNSDGQDRRMDKSQRGAIRPRFLKECSNIFENNEGSFPLSHVESSPCGPRKVTEVEAADALEFANACFPSKSREEIETLLHDCDYNLDFLAASLLVDAQEESNVPGKTSHLKQEATHDRTKNFDSFLDRRDDKYHCNIPTEVASSSNNFSDSGSTTSGSVFSTNHSTTNSTAFSSSSDSGSEGKDEKDDDWRVDLLAHMLPHTPRSEILFVLDECGGDISHAACKLMPPDLEDEPEEKTNEQEERRNNSALSPNAGSASQRPTGYSTWDFDASLVHLCSVFPDLSIDGLRRHLELTNGNQEQAVDMVLALNFSGQGIPNGTEDHKLGGKKRRKRTIRGPAIRSQIITVAGATSVPCSPTTGITGFTRENNLDSPTDDPVECRRYASKLYEERNDFLSRAASAHRSGNGTGLGKGRALASYYSEEGHRRGALAKKWDERAAMATIRQELNSNSDSFTVDLHGLRVSEAVPLSQQLVEKWWKNVASEGKTKKHAARSKPYTIICGKGIHSQGGIPRLFPAISKSLIENGWELSLETRGCVIVNGKRTRSGVR